MPFVSAILSHRPWPFGQGDVHPTPSTSTLEAAAPEVPGLDRLALIASACTCACDFVKHRNDVALQVPAPSSMPPAPSTTAAPMTSSPDKDRVCTCSVSSSQY